MHIKVKVFPDAKKELVRKIDESQFELYIRESPKAGSANRRVMEILQEHFPQKRIRLVSGHLSRSKVFEING